MNVGDLKRVIKDFDDNLPVYIFFPESVYAGSREDSMRYATHAKFSPKGNISNAFVEIVAGASFDW